MNETISFESTSGSSYEFADCIFSPWGYDGYRLLSTGFEHRVTVSDPWAQKWLWSNLSRKLIPFIGVIPTRVKEAIHNAKPDFERIFLIREAAESQWKPEPVRDPLIVGRSHFGNHYLIEKFDCTPAEHYIASEFTE